MAGIIAGMLLLRADFSQRAVVTPDSHTWTVSPQAGVERVMLDRVGDEVARATSLVRYAAGSHFPRHVHGGGEEIFVLEGGFSTDAQHFPAGCYLRSPPGSSHQPFSEEGALLFVKLRQMTAEERNEVRIDSGDAARWTHREGRERCPLFADGREQVWLERLRSGQDLALGPGIAVESQRALDQIFARCAKDAACSKAFPTLGQDFAAVKARLQKAPVKFAMRDPVEIGRAHV